MVGQLRHDVVVADPRGAYRQFLRESVDPRLRELGFTGSGNTFVLPDERYWALVGFQADWRTALAGAPTFTINLTFVGKADWDQERPSWMVSKRPPANTFGLGVGEQIRIGALVPVSDLDYDRWWTLDGRTPADEIAADVIAAVRDHALPWFRTRMG